VKVTMLWSAVGAAGFSIAYWLGGEWIIARLTDQAVVRAAAMRYLPWAALLPLASVAGFQLDGVFIGATRTRELMKAMAVSLAVFLLAAWTLAGSLGNHGLWLALTVFMVARGVTLIVQLPSIERASCAGGRP
jgi:MATE family multidrug resistance protein